VIDLPVKQDSRENHQVFCPLTGTQRLDGSTNHEIILSYLSV